MTAILLAHCFGHDLMAYIIAAVCGGAVTATVMFFALRHRKTQSENVRRDEE